MNEENEFTEGEMVRVRSGAFAACTGRVVAIDDERRRLRVHVDLKVTTDADSQTLELNFRDVEKIRFSED